MAKRNWARAFMGILAISLLIWKWTDISIQQVAPDLKDERQRDLKSSSDLGTLQSSFHSNRASTKVTAHLAKVQKIELQESTTAQVKLLEEILNAKNDNDPRLDHDFNNLSEKTKIAFQKDYEELQSEARNEKGTIIFLLGKNLKSPRDFEFFKKVINESPCLNLSDCNKNNETNFQSSENTADEVTLEYPQIVAIKSLERFITTHPEPSESSEAMKTIQAALQSKNPLAKQLASSWLATHRLQDFPVSSITPGNFYVR